MNRASHFRNNAMSRTIFFSIALTSVLLLSSSIATSQAPNSVPPSGLQPQLQPLAFFVGEWNCEGEFIASKKQIAAHIAVATDMEGSLITFRWSDKEPNRFHALELWGFDKSANHFTNFIHDNFGGVREFSSPGWDNDTLTWTGDLLATPSATTQRFVIERKSAKEFVITWETRKAETDWTGGDRLTCKQ